MSITRPTSTMVPTALHEDKFQEIASYGPVTAVRFLAGDRLAVGYGPVLRVFLRQNGKIALQSTRRVFRRNKIHCIATGANPRYVGVAGSRSFALVDLEKETSEEKALNEWIVAVHLVPSEVDPATPDLLLLTSHNEVVHVSGSTVVAKVHCHEKSLLYSGCIQSANGRVYIAAGTVMSGVIVWDWAARTVLHRLHDHEGSIFAVAIDPGARHVITCSDDRSVKIYDFAGGLLASGWGHGSRIWLLLFCRVSPERVTLFSTGEDCTARLWEYTPGSSLLQQLRCFTNHEGKHAWSGDAGWGNCLVTGGADGKVRVMESEDHPQAVLSVQDAPGLAPAEAVKLYVEASGTAVVVSTLGNVFVHQGSWHQLDLDGQHVQSAILRVCPAKNLVVAYTKQGLLVVDLSGAEPDHYWLPCTHNVINFFVCPTTHGVLLLWDTPQELVAQEYTTDNGRLVSALQYSLQRPDRRIFCPTAVFYDESQHWLVVGSRHANLAVFHLNESTQTPIRKLCAGDTVTSITEFSNSPGPLSVLVTVRDGIYMVLELGEEITVLLQNKFSKGSVEGGFVQANQRFLYGFRSGAFCLWNETKQLEVANVHCGGGHRQWGYDTATHTFSYLGKSGLVATQLRFPFGLYDDVITAGTHGREIRALAVGPWRTEDGRRLLASASEDACIKLGLVDSEGTLEPLWTMTNHISGLQLVQFLSRDYMASSAANEELLVWAVARPENEPLVAEVARIPPSGANPDLRIMDFALVETRDGFFIAAGYSNSQIKIWFFDKATKTFTLKAERTYKTCCILHVQFLETSETVHLVSATTDGCLSIYDVTGLIRRNEPTELEIVDQKKVHVSGVKALYCYEKDIYWVLVTGGDDNSLVVSQFVKESDRLNLVMRQEQAASAAITGIADAGHNRVFVASVDQIVRLWSFEPRLECLAASYTTVADTGCCVGLPMWGLYGVGGAGLSFFKATL